MSHLHFSCILFPFIFSIFIYVYINFYALIPLYFTFTFRHVSFLTCCPYFTVLFIHQLPNYTFSSISYFSAFLSPIDAFIPIFFFCFFVLYFFVFYTYFYTLYKFSREFYFTHQFCCFLPWYPMIALRNDTLRLSFCCTALHISSVQGLRSLSRHYIHLCVPYAILFFHPDDGDSRILWNTFIRLHIMSQKKTIFQYHYILVF